MISLLFVISCGVALAQFPPGFCNACKTCADLQRELQRLRINPQQSIAPLEAGYLECDFGMLRARDEAAVRLLYFGTPVNSADAGQPAVGSDDPLPPTIRLYVRLPADGSDNPEIRWFYQDESYPFPLPPTGVQCPIKLSLSRPLDRGISANSVAVLRDLFRGLKVVTIPRSQQLPDNKHKAYLLTLVPLKILAPPAPSESGALLELPTLMLEKKALEPYARSKNEMLEQMMRGLVSPAVSDRCGFCYDMPFVTMPLFREHPDLEKYLDLWARFWANVEERWPRPSADGRR